MPDERLEAHYHFTLSAMVDLIDEYGYSNVMNDLDAMIVDKVDFCMTQYEIASEIFVNQKTVSYTEKMP